jgi:hypothetical protein
MNRMMRPSSNVTFKSIILQFHRPNRPTSYGQSRAAAEHREADDGAPAQARQRAGGGQVDLFIVFSYATGNITACSLLRTRLQGRFAVNRENYREYRRF